MPNKRLIFTQTNLYTYKYVSTIYNFIQKKILKKIKSWLMVTVNINLLKITINKRTKAQIYDTYQPIQIVLITHFWQSYFPFLSFM